MLLRARRDGGGIPRSIPGPVTPIGRHDPLPGDALSGIHVLIIDDAAEAGDLIRTVLRYCGALVSVAASAGERLETLQRVLPDVRSLRARPPEAGGRLPVIAVTAHGATHGPDRTLPAGFQSHLRKPVDPWDLCRVVASMMRKP